jgi:hypothetical protein
MGFKDYESYLHSLLWRKIRKRVLKRDKHKCRCCGELAGEAHHRSYRREALNGSDISPIIAICRKCHDEIELEDGKKNSFEEAERKLKCKLEGRQAGPPQLTKKQRRQQAREARQKAAQEAKLAKDAKYLAVAAKDPERAAILKSLRESTPVKRIHGRVPDAPLVPGSAWRGWPRKHSPLAHLINPRPSNAGAGDRTGAEDRSVVNSQSLRQQNEGENPLLGTPKNWP